MPNRGNPEGSPYRKKTAGAAALKGARYEEAPARRRLAVGQSFSFAIGRVNERAAATV